MIEESGTCYVQIPKRRYSAIEKKVVELYDACGVNTIPLNPISILETKGYILRRYSDLDCDVLNDLLAAKSDLEAFNFLNPYIQKYVIYYNSNQNIKRIRFTLMHEIGHIVLGHKEESPLAKKEADFFAAYALAPYPLINFKECEDCIDVEKIFDVSAQCAQIAFASYQNWYKFGGNDYKTHELKLINMIKKYK